MVFEFIKQPIVMMFVCAFVVFAELCVAKKAMNRVWFTNLTKNIQYPEVRRGINLIVGIVISVGIALGDMALMCDAFGIKWLWELSIGSGFIATFIYIAIEKVFGESKANELGKLFCEVLSHSTQFDGKLTENGKRELAKQVAASLRGIDTVEAAKENKAIADAVKRLDAFLADGKITDAEKAEAKKIVANAGLYGNSLLAKYSDLLK